MSCWPCAKKIEHFAPVQHTRPSVTEPLPKPFICVGVNGSTARYPGIRMVWGWCASARLLWKRSWGSENHCYCFYIVITVSVMVSEQAFLFACRVQWVRNIMFSEPFLFFSVKSELHFAFSGHLNEMGLMITLHFIVRKTCKQGSNKNWNQTIKVNVLFLLCSTCREFEFSWFVDQSKQCKRYLWVHCFCSICLGCIC